MTQVFLKRAEVVTMTGLSYSSIYKLENAEDFPARRKLTPGRLGRVGWVRSEVEAWVQERGAVTRKAA